ncbi:MAG: MerR family transcriptional regulator, partial [Parvularculaceae bacterium]
MADEFLTIGDVARRTGLSARALRHYEAEGLLAPARSENGRRAYGPRELERLARLRLLKKAGITLAQIRLQPPLAGDDRPNYATLVQARLEALQAARDAHH